MDEVTINTADDNVITIRPALAYEDAVYFHMGRVKGTDKVDGWLTAQEWEKLKQAVESMLY